MRKVYLFIMFGIIAGMIIAVITLGKTIDLFENHQSTVTIVERGPVSISSMSPAFTLPDTANHLVNLKDFRGKVLIINFWTTWCEPCKQEMPVLDELQSQYIESLAVLGVNIGDSEAEVREFLEGVEVTYPILLDEKGIVGAAYHVVGYPTTYFLDADGIIHSKTVGSITRRALEQYLAPLGIMQ